METFFGRLKNEMFYGYEKEYTSFEVFSKAIADYIDYYNNRRIQAKTKWMPPVKFREASMMKNELFSSTGAVQKIGYILFLALEALFVGHAPSSGWARCRYFIFAR